MDTASSGARKWPTEWQRRPHPRRVTGSWARLGRALLLVWLMVVAAPTLAHKDHKKAAAAASQHHASSAPEVSAPIGPSSTAAVPQAPPRRDPPLTGIARLLDWLGRLHPIVVHFPIAFFPAALLTAIVGRRRPAFAEPVRFLVLAGGITAPIAALLGWLDAGFAWTSDERLLNAHRWLGSLIGLLALGLAIFASRKPAHDQGPAMIGGLSVITMAIAVQGWLGGALVHGLDHLNW